ncbi:MAG: recombinase family protein, partial [Oscillospiraceae bacterium]|nr:recombinase family protein [Oscillospiraceae bacterium]
GHHIVTDPKTAPVIQEIFRRRAAGESIVAITRWLNESGTPSPFTYRHQTGIIRDERFAQGKPWQQQTVKYILKNEMYLGHMVQGRQISEFYAGRPVHALPREQWTVVQNTHEPLVSEELFQKVQSIMDEKNKVYHNNLGKYDHLGKSENLLKGLVYCADCGRPMVRYKQVNGQKVTYFFMCSNYAARLDKSGCVYKFLPEAELSSTIKLLLEQEIKLAVDATTLMRNQKARPVPDYAAALKIAGTERARLDTLRHRLMQDYLSGIINEADYNRIKEQYRFKAASLEQRIKEYRIAIEKHDRLLSDKNPWLTAFSALHSTSELARQIIQSLVERITVYTNERIEVRFCFRDERQALLESIQSMKEVEAG